jgi:hypothetical protein
MTELATAPKPSDIFRRLEQLEAEGAITPKGQELLDGARQQGLWAPAQSQGFMDTAQRYASNAVENVRALPGAISDAWTGEGKQVEFPDAKEITDIQDVGFWESFWPNIKAGLTVDPKEKAAVFADSFAGDSRFGGAGEDAHGNPYLMWNGKPYYINSPGMSGTDATDIVAQITQLLPASKYAGKGLSLTSRAARGAPAYAATNVAQQYGTMAAGGKDQVDLRDAGYAGAIGGAAEAVLPPIAKTLGQGVKAVGRGLNRAIPGRSYLPPDPSKLPQKGAIPYTQGQRSGDMNIIRREEAMRQGAEGPIASDIMRGFDARQGDAIASRAAQVEGKVGAGLGNPESAPTDIGSRLKVDLQSARDTSKAAVRSAYKAASETEAALTVDAARSMADDMARVPKEMELFTTDGMTQLNAALKKLGNFKMLAKSGNLKPANIKMIERFRQGLNSAIDGTQGTERAALVRMKSTLDRHMSEAIDKGLLMGDEEAIGLLKNARELRRLHAVRFEAGKGDKTGNALLKVLDDNGATPLQTVNYIVNTGKASGQDVALGMVRRLKDIFGPDSEQMRLVKSAYLLNAFTKTEQGARSFNRSSIVANARTLIDGDGKAVARELFTADEIKTIKALVNEVAPTITPADARNPSRSAFAFLSAMIDRGLISTAGSGVRHLPFVDGLGRGMQNAAGAMAAGNLTSQLPHLTARPLLSSGAATVGNLYREGR